MTVYELSRDQFIDLKCKYLCELADNGERDYPSYSEFASMESYDSFFENQVMEHYEGIDFVHDDFPVTAGMGLEMNERVKRYYHTLYGCTAVITIRPDGSARLVVRIYTGNIIHNKVHKNERAAMQAWYRMEA